jgi:hypothetical protein
VTVKETKLMTTAYLNFCNKYVIFANKFFNFTAVNGILIKVKLSLVLK